MEHNENCGPQLKSSVYDRGPGDTNQAMFPFEKAMADAINARAGGKPTNPPAKPTGFRVNGPGTNER